LPCKPSLEYPGFVYHFDPLGTQWSICKLSLENDHGNFGGLSMRNCLYVDSLRIQRSICKLSLDDHWSSMGFVCHFDIWKLNGQLVTF